MIHDKTGLLHLSQLMLRRNILHVVISPGSRNAPLIAVFGSEKAFQTYTIVDERSAAFFALGLAQRRQEPVALICTSGTAALNYAPAIAEAFYQRIPLVVITADRPAEWIDQGDGQTIHQTAIFGPHVRKSVQLPQAIRNEDDLWFNDRLVSEALNAVVDPVFGPVHINVPLAEPLYGLPLLSEGKVHDIRLLTVQKTLASNEINQLKHIWSSCGKKLILVGQMTPDANIQNMLSLLARREDVVVLTETTSNCFDASFVGCIDRSLAVMKKAEDFEPDLLITFGGPVVSKRIKSFLRKAAPTHHWNVDPAEAGMDTYQALTLAIPMAPVDFLDIILSFGVGVSSSFASNWQLLKAEAQIKHDAFLASTAWSDLKIFDLLTNAIPDGCEIQLGNSTPVRYAQLFAGKWAERFDSNRGTSGIDGSLSTAVGAAVASQKTTLLITGDLSFFYDSNGLWNKHLPSNLKIIVVNNRGGGIFRFIEGPDKTGFMETFFEAQHETSAVRLAETYKLACFEANDEASFGQAIKALFAENSRPALLEVSSPAQLSGETIRAYFSWLKA